MNLVFTLTDGLQEQTDKQHCGSRSTHERCQNPAHSYYHGVGGGRCTQVASYADASRGDEQRHQQKNERHVVVNHLMLQFM